MSHGNNHVVEYNCEVTVGGLALRPGDIVACDRHGVLKLPERTLPHLLEACREIALAELPVLEPCRRAIMSGETADLEDLREWRAQMAAARKSVKFD